MIALQLSAVLLSLVVLGAHLLRAGAPCLVWLVLALSTRYVSVASMGAAMALPILVAVLPTPGGPGLLGFTIALAAFVVWAHRSNLRRLVRGEENRFGRGKAAGEGS